MKCERIKYKICKFAIRCSKAMTRNKTQQNLNVKLQLKSRGGNLYIGRI